MPDADARLVEPSTDALVHLWPLPAELSSEVTAEEYSWRLLGAGTVRAPRGPTPKTHAYSTFFPDEGDVGEPWCPDDWRPPLDLGYQLNRWIQTNARLRFTVTETGIDAIVFIASLREVWGELGRLRYELDLVELVELTVDSVPASDAAQASTDDTLFPITGPGAAFELGGGPPPPPPPAPPDTIVVRAGQTLPILARLYLGNSARWTVLAEANLALFATLGIGGTAWADPLPAGLVLAIPGGPTVGTTR